MIILLRRKRPEQPGNIRTGGAVHPGEKVEEQPELFETGFNQRYDAKEYENLLLDEASEVLDLPCSVNIKRLFDKRVRA